MNYEHLHYFLQVAKLGGVLRASERLHLSPQTIRRQIQSLEEALGTPLFAKSGCGLALTEAGRMVLGHAEDIFSTGAELEEALRDYPRKGKRLEFRVGVADAVPKTIACRLIEPASHLPEPVRICGASARRIGGGVDGGRLRRGPCHRAASWSSCALAHRPACLPPLGSAHAGRSECLTPASGQAR